MTPAAVLDRGWQKIGRESGRKRGDNERKEAEDAERMRPSCVGDGEESDAGHETSDREPRQQPWSEGGEQRARLRRPLGHALATAEVSAEHESEQQRERREEDAAPASTATTTATSVSRPAAASWIVSPGEEVRRCASAQPAMIAATASAAV